MPRAKLFDEQVALAQAMQLFWKKGYYATSIQDLVSHLNISKASLYNAFGGKRELFDKALTHYRTTNTLAVQRFLNSHDNVKAGFKALFTMAVEQSMSDTDCKGCFVVNTITELTPNDTTITPALTQNKQVFESLFFDYLSSGVQKNQIAADKDLQAIASLLFTFYNGLKVVTKINFNKENFLAAVDALLTILE